MSATTSRHIAIPAKAKAQPEFNEDIEPSDFPQCEAIAIQTAMQARPASSPSPSALSSAASSPKSGLSPIAVAYATYDEENEECEFWNQ